MVAIENGRLLSGGISVFPNPVAAGGTLNIVLAEELAEVPVTLLLFDAGSRLVSAQNGMG